jgi:hypothetical protein
MKGGLVCLCHPPHEAGALYYASCAMIWLASVHHGHWQGECSRQWAMVEQGEMIGVSE